MKSEHKKNEKLRNLRLSLGLSQKKFAEKLGLTRSLIAAYETEKNPISNNVLLRVSEIFGIKNEYFESEMTPQEAFEKYSINPADILKINPFDDMVCCVYESLEDYAGRNPLVKANLKIQFLSLLFAANIDENYHFIKLNNSTNEPFAKNGDILIVERQGRAVNGDFIVAKFQESYIIFQYFVVGIDEALFKGSNNIEIKLKGNEREQIEILGIIKQKISTSI
ncbi:helix-turn-helix domain-containing protein [Helicobacter cinaedi]|uniref:helix-turn-helix domain-containing protein n=1 Tax=Helicobacter cinaedi TaxID=213 RepID=UPI000D7C2375|nr:helix-turn-helix domain-containing protein [Helicobacter cinaedi]